MDLFSRFRRTEQPEQQLAIPTTLPSINQRVTIAREGHEPAASRVDDERGEALVLAAPNVPLETGDEVTVMWEEELGWYRLATTVIDVDDALALPTISVSRRGRLTAFDDRRNDLRRDIELPLDVRVVTARAVKPGRQLSTHTLELSGNLLRFSTSAPFAPGDMLEVELSLREGDPITARTKVIRVDTVQESWRQSCTVVFDEMLRSDRARLVTYLEASPAPLSNDALRSQTQEA